MKKINLVSIFVLFLALNLVLTSCFFKKKTDNKPKSPIEKVALACIVKNEKIHWIFETATPLECPNYSDPYIAEDSLAFGILECIDNLGLAKARIDVHNSWENAVYFERGDDMKMTKIDVVYVSYGKKGVVRYGIINEKLYVKKFTIDELVDTFPKNIRDVMANLGIYILNK